MPSIILIIAGMLLFAGPASGQSKFLFQLRGGYGNFNMTSMRDFQEKFIASTKVNSKATDTFAPYYQYGMGISKGIGKNNWIGLLLERGSTSGRVTYEDYSGELRFDNRLQYNSLGVVYYNRKSLKDGHLKFLKGIEANLFFSKLAIESYKRIYDEEENKTGNFKSTGIGLKPYVGIEYPIMQLPVGFTLGYMVHMSKPYDTSDPMDKQMITEHTNSLKPGWGGFRANLSLAIPIL